MLNFHDLLGTLISDGALLNKWKCSTIFMHYHSPLKEQLSGTIQHSPISNSRNGKLK